ncbi:MAG TPA: hypothetical protein VFO10_18045 [Oligoflexus sp.]|uniref:hypothetical protein n=1 Tax=Oligoflexus sp. TaxID=1971216 RepID=UPI002D7FE4B6|nr:hypothetical protein [Oligoflexus sp.]HET9239167.1 hypothetical protein [Oligoflexus sp.]
MEVIFFVCVDSGEVIAKVINYAGRTEKWDWVEGCSDNQVLMLRKNARERCGEICLKLVRKIDPSKPLSTDNFSVLKNLNSLVALHGVVL